MRRLSRVLVVTLALAGAACAPGGAAGSPTARGSRGTVITQEEIEGSGAATAYDLVRGLRPMWLVPRGRHSTQNPAGDVIWVYVNSTRLGPPEALQQVAAPDVGSIRFYDAAAANYRFGTGHLNGAIQVIPRGTE
ncbi:MAG: hypothetical protein AB1941_11830 [Gemmatimonadota bacterium]